VPGLFCPTGDDGQASCNLPFFLGLAPYVGDEKLDMAQSKISDYHRELNMRDGLLPRTLTWMVPVFGFSGVGTSMESG